MHRSRVYGFTLIELVVVIAIVGILAAIAVPSFANQVRKSRRAEAMTTLQDQQLLLERHRVDHASFATYTLPTLTSDYYKFTLEGTSATGYTLVATPQGDQQKDSCGTLKLVSAAGVTSKNPANCW